MPECLELTYHLPDGLLNKVNVVVKSGDEMKDIFDNLPPVELPGHEPERAAVFSTENPRLGIFVMVAYRSCEGRSFVSHYLGMQNEYERCMHGGDEKGIESYRGSYNGHSIAIHKGRADTQLANAARILRVQKFLAGINL